MNTNQTAAFAVVGHPNKGKSSIVSTLAHNDNVQISSRSGTTALADRYRVSTANAHYDLIDTPGFQRPRKVLHWLKTHCSNASERAATVFKFVNDSDCQQQFKDEVALLRPIVDGAAILYVVDGSRPYGEEYEAEMDILRWTGQPSMALINPIESSDCVTEWQNALTQYFKSVRVFNPMTADFEKQLELLQTFAHLNPAWSESLNRITRDLRQQRGQQKQHSIIILARMVDDLCRYQACQKLLSLEQAKRVEPVLARQYKAWMKQREETAIDELLTLYAHSQTRIAIEQFDLPPDLFDCDEWFAWGLDKKQLISAAALAGAVSGAAVDVAVAGHSLMLGALGGSLLGAGSAWFGADKLVDVKISGLPLGGHQACVGPIKNRNFPYVVIGRFLHVYQQISALTHADRSELTVSAEDFKDRVDNLEKAQQKSLHTACERLIKQKPVDDLESVLRPLFD
ncbi:GTPase/DUF3482 domain-containing protein [Alteromonas oceanisediminis]|uniref:GTPase/DUF3482 domain-containing protein n=1 Tax=Alteromonas oceanisediminis TaxID=2836180 RepID=UPI001BDA9D10|nr:GTPase/DUF3482 domain-containing protein [Alteromonas oceanisediminis]MBT0585948.1 DUF3482 domain-containing protein [Alteromonas oceanisediminis]